MNRTKQNFSSFKYRQPQNTAAKKLRQFKQCAFSQNRGKVREKGQMTMNTCAQKQMNPEGDFSEKKTVPYK